MRRVCAVLSAAGLWGIGCGAMDDISDTKAEVEKSNEHMEELIRLSKETDQNLRKMTDLMQGTVSEVHQSNEQMGQMIDIARGTLDSVQDKDKKLESMLTLARQSLGEIKSANGTSIKLLDQVTQTRQATENTLTEVKKQEAAILNTTLTELVKVVRDTSQENYYRVASAMNVYQLLREYHLPAAWYSKFVSANIEMCNHSLGNEGVGKVCTGFFMGGPLMARKPGDGTTRKPSPLVGALVSRLMTKLPKSWANSFKVEPFRPNLVWALALDSEFAKAFYSMAVANTNHPLAATSKEFLIVARQMLMTSIQVIGEKAASGEEITTAQLEEFRNRSRVVKTLQALPGIGNPAGSRALAASIHQLIEASEKWTLDEDDQRIINELQQRKFA